MTPPAIPPGPEEPGRRLITLRDPATVVAARSRIGVRTGSRRRTAGSAEHRRADAGRVPLNASTEKHGPAKPIIAPTARPLNNRRHPPRTRESAPRRADDDALLDPLTEHRERVEVYLQSDGAGERAHRHHRVHVSTRNADRDQCAPFCAVQAPPQLSGQRLSRTAAR